MAVEKLTAVGWGLVMFGIIVGLGVLVVQKFGDQAAQCAAGYTFNTSQQYCVNATLEDPTAPLNTAWVAINYANTQLGTSGLTSWLPVIIVVLIAGLIFAIFGRKESY